MAKFNLTFKRSADKELQKLPSPVLKKIVPKIKKLVEDPYPVYSKKLSGSSHHAYRIREGDYRVLYVVEKTRIFIFRIGHRREVYRKELLF